MSEENGNIYGNITPEAAVAVFVKNAKGHGKYERGEKDGEKLYRYTVKAPDGDIHSVSLETRTAINGKRMVLFTLYTCMLVSCTPALALEVCRVNTTIHSGKLSAPLVSIDEEKGEITISKALPLGDNVIKALSACELDCIGLSRSLERHIDGFYRAPVFCEEKTVIEEISLEALL